MHPEHLSEMYSPDEIARAAGVPEHAVIAAVGRRDAFLTFDQAVRIGRRLTPVAAPTPSTLVTPGIVATPSALFSIFSTHADRRRSMPLVVSGTAHALALIIVFAIASLGLASRSVVTTEEKAAEPMRLVFLATPGPGGGGGGGGLRQRVAPPKAERLGRSKISSPLPPRPEPKVPAPQAKPPEPKPDPLKSEQLPVVVAPIVTAPADTRNRVGALEQSTSPAESHGPGNGGGVGTGTGTGIGPGDGAGVGPGSGGGTGGGPHRPGSGITPPRLLREVKADYTEDARRRGVAGEVVFEIVVRRDGSVGDVKLLHGLGYGLDDRAAQALRQWRFAPAERQGVPVDVVVEVSVEFRLR